MALYIDFNFINIRDLIDLSEIDSELENQLQYFVEEIFENPLENRRLNRLFELKNRAQFSRI